MAKMQEKLDVLIGAIDRFSGPFKAFDQRLKSAGDSLQRFSAQSTALGNATGFTRLQGAVGNVGNSLSNVGAQGQRFIGSLSGGILKLTALFGVASGGILGMAASVGAAGENAGIMASKAGVALESFQKLAYGASFSNLQADEFSVMLGKLGNQSLQAATGNKELAASFKLAGVSVKNSNGTLKNADQVMLDLADSFAAMQDGPAKTALAVKVLGEEGLKLLPFLSQGSDAIRKMGKDAENLGIVFDEKASASSADFNKALGDVKFAAQGLANTILIDALPVIQELLGEFKGWVVANRQLIGQNVRGWIEGFAKRLPEILQTGRDIISGIGTLCQWLGTLSDALGGADKLFMLIAGVMAGPLIGAVWSLGGALVSLGAALLATPIGWFIGGCALIIAAGVAIYKNWDEVSAFFSAFGDGIKEAFGEIPQIFSDLGTAFSELLGEWKNTFANFFSGFIPDGIKNLFSGFGSSGPNVNFEGGGGGSGPHAMGGFGPPAGAAGLKTASAGVNSTTTKVERSEVRLVLPAGVTAQGGENAKGVQVNESTLGPTLP